MRLVTLNRVKDEVKNDLKESTRMLCLRDVIATCSIAAMDENTNPHARLPCCLFFGAIIELFHGIWVEGSC